MRQKSRGRWLDLPVRQRPAHGLFLSILLSACGEHDAPELLAIGELPAAEQLALARRFNPAHVYTNPGHFASPFDYALEPFDHALEPFDGPAGRR